MGVKHALMRRKHPCRSSSRLETLLSVASLRRRIALRFRSAGTGSREWLLNSSLLDTILLDDPIQTLDKEGFLLVRPHMEQIVENRLNCERGIWSRERSTREKTHACCARGTSCCKPFLTSTQKRAFTR